MYRILIVAFVCCLMGLVGPAWAWNQGTGTLISKFNDETEFEYWPLYTTSPVMSPGFPAWWVTREGDAILDMGDVGDPGTWSNEFDLSGVVQIKVTPALVGPKVGCKGRIVRPGMPWEGGKLVGRGAGGSIYKVEDEPAGGATGFERVRVYAGEPGSEEEVGFLMGHPTLIDGGLEVMGTLAEEKEATKEDGVEYPHFSDVWPLRIRTNPGQGVIGFLESGRHRIELYFVNLYGYLPRTEITEGCCGAAILGGSMVKVGDKVVWVVEMRSKMPPPPPPPPVMIAGPGAGTTPLSEGLFPKGTDTDVRQSQSRFRGEIRSSAPFDAHLAFVAKRVAGSGGHEAGRHEPKNTNVEGDLTGRKGTVGTFQQMFMRIPAGSFESDWNRYTASDFGGTEVIQMYVSQGRFSAEEKFGVNPGGSNLAAAIAVLEAEAKDTCRIDTFVQIRVPYLGELPPGGSNYEKVGGTCVHHGPSDKPLTGPDAVPAECRNPDNNHWGTQELVDQIRTAGFQAQLATGGTIRVNDMSLPQGGVFDIGGNWKKPHSPKMGHAVGRAVDISTRFVGSSGSKKDLVQEALEDAALIETTDTTRFQPQMFFIEDEGKANEHFHVMK